MNRELFLANYTFDGTVYTFKTRGKRNLGMFQVGRKKNYNNNDVDNCTQSRIGYGN